MKRNVFIKGLASYSFANLVMYILSLVTVPLFISYFGLTKYGLWIVLLSLISYLSNSQFGLNTVVAVLLSKSEDRTYHKTVLTRALDLLLITAGIILVAGFIFYLQPSWAVAVIGTVPADFSGEVLTSFFYLVLFFALRLPLSVISAGFIGHQDVQLERLYIGILPQTLSFVALIITRQLDGNLVTLAQIIGVGNLVIAIGSAIHYKMRYNYLYALRKTSLLAEPTKNQILKNGGIFFVAGLSGMIITNTDNIILSQLFGADQVAGYSLVFKIYMIAFSVFFILNSAFWPIFGRAFAKNEIAWIKTVFVESCVNFPLLAGLIWLGGLAFMQDFLNAWIGSTHAFIGLSVVFALGGYGYVASVVNFQNGLLSSVNVGKPFMWIGILEAVVNLGLSIVLCQLIGPAGVAYGTFLAAALVSFFLLPRAIKKYIHADLDFPWQMFLKHFCFILLPCLIGMIFLSTLTMPAIYLLVAKLALIAGYVVGSSYFIPDSSWLFIKSKLKFLN